MAREGLLAGQLGVPQHYGSPAGELAACVRGVGLADRSDLQILEIAGRPPAVAAVVEHATGWSLEPGGVVAADGTWWCARSPGCLLLLREPGSHQSLDTSVLPPGHDVKVTDRSEVSSALGVVGQATFELLATLGAVEDVRLAPCFGEATIGGVEVEVLIQSDRRALVIATRQAASLVRDAVESAGRPFGLCSVGAEALARFTLRERMLETAARPPTA